MNTANKKLNIAVEWEKSKEVFREAEVLLQQKMAAGALSRAYYAAFHAGKAVLLTEGLEVKSHQALGRLFSLHFVKTGKFDVRYSRILSKAQKYREEADYSSEFVFTQADAEERLKEVKEFLVGVETFLKQAGYQI